MENKFILPAEWHPQQAVLLTWPHSHSDWAPTLKVVEPVYINMAREIAARQKAVIICYDMLHQQHVLQQLTHHSLNLNNINLISIATNDTWIRDYGPITVLKDKQRYFLDFTFNAWGEKYQAQLDDQVTAQLYQRAMLPVGEILPVDFVLEGGSIDSNGHGSLLTTENCLLNPKRNAHLSKQQIEQQLNELLGIEQVLWLTQGSLQGDDTDSHVDTLARFCDPQTICYVQCTNHQDPHFKSLQAMEDELKAMRTQQGQVFDLVPLPLPQPKLNALGKRLPATYANFLIINQAVLAPTYQDQADEVALKQLQQCFPKHKIVPIDCLPLIEQFGSLHCATMQIV